LLSGLLMPSISGGWSSRLRSFTADEQMTRASAVDVTTFNIAGLAGPACAGLFTGWLGVHWTIAVLAGLLVAALPMAWALPKRWPQTQKHDAPLLQDALTGLKIIATNKPLFRITLLSVLSYIGVGMVWVACPLVGLAQTGSAGFGGVMMSVMSVGALAATAAYAKWPAKYSPDVVALATTVILGAALLVLALAGNILVALIAMFVAGLADGPQLAAVFAVRHREAPERSRSQVFMTGASLKITAAAVGTGVAGQLAKFSLVVMILSAAAVQMLAVLVYLVALSPITPAQNRTSLQG
jgi:MFS family permease